MKKVKRTDIRDHERAMTPVLTETRRKWEEQEDDAILAQTEWDMFPERRNGLLFLLDGLPGITIIELNAEKPEEEEK
jgi:hypothetical protein